MKNILLIICDQLSATALKCYGNSYVNAPNIESLADDGVIFNNTYTACPLCQPSRASFWTSKYPHQTKVTSNLQYLGFDALSDEIQTMGELFSNNGYDCIHFGKKHDYGSLRGFKIVESEWITRDRDNPAITYDYETYLDEDTTRKIIDYISSYNKDIPFLAVADLQNPHNICNYIGENELGHKDFGLTKDLPPLPDNFYFNDIHNRPEFLQYLCCAHRRQSQVTNWSEDDFRHYLYAYYYYIELVDKQIGRILDCLEQSGQRDDTLIVFFADHGEGMASHQLVTKYGAFYEETNRVPLIFSGKDIESPRRIDGLSSLIDIMPTIAQYAGIECNNCEGISLYNQLIGKTDYTNNTYVISEWFDEFSGYTIPGRMYLDSEYKYTIYLENNSEELYDIKNDRLETTNLAVKPEFNCILEEYRDKLTRHINNIGDDFFSLETCYDTSRYRQHKPGITNHTGANAVIDYTVKRRANK